MDPERRFTLLISSSNINRGTGGIERYIKAQIQAMVDNGIECYSLFPVRKRIGRLSFDYIGIMRNYDFIGVCDVEDISDELKKTGEFYEAEIFIHSLLNWNFSYVKRLLDLFSDVRINFYLHDYYTTCIQYNLLKNGRSYCGNANVTYDKCRDCSFCDMALKHRACMEDFLRSISEYDVRFIAPSDVAKDIWSETYPKYSNRVFVIPHLIGEGEFTRKRKADYENIKIAFIGSQTVNKGWEEWLRVSNSIIQKQLPYELYYFGEKRDTRPKISSISVSTTRDGKNAMIDALRENDIDIAVLLSNWPETYSYTYYESTGAGCLVITMRNSGNIAKMVTENKNGIVIGSEEELNSLLLDFERLRELLQSYLGSNEIFPYAYRDNIILPESGGSTNTVLSMDNKRISITKIFVELLYKFKYAMYLKG